MGLLSGTGYGVVKPKPAARLTLKKFHTARYLHALQRAENGKWDLEALRMGIGTGDCPIFRGMYEHATLAAGATLTGAKHILDNKTKIAFNPSGGFHHAHPERSAGFCYINDVGLACHIFAEQGKRVFYLDIDVHHGDGVQYEFYDRSDVFTLSFHEDPRTLFPGTGFIDEIGTGAGKGYCVNVPLPGGTYDTVYGEAFNKIALPLLDAYKPDVIVLELGVDGLAGDPLTHFFLTNNIYADIIKLLLKRDIPILATGGGGYNVQNSVRAWALAWTVFCGNDQSRDMNIGLGGVMLESTDWQGGLRDREIVISKQQRQSVIPAVKAAIKEVKRLVFTIHGL